MFVLVVRNNANPRAVEMSYTLSAFLAAQNMEFAFLDSSALYDMDARMPTSSDGEMPILAVVLGGDGTILRTASLIGDAEIPILGINFGNLGFLANDSERGVIELVSSALADELLCEKRTNLQIDVVCEADDNEPFEERKEHQMLNSALETESYGVNSSGLSGKRRFFSLNEAVITRGSLGRTINYSLDVSDVHMADVCGDGVIIATATGSTAYSLAAGGPIVHPGFGGMIIQPLAPHTLTARAILTDVNDVACIDLGNNREGREATLFIDGDIVLFGSPIKEVYVRRGAAPTRLLYAEANHFYRYAADTFFKN